MRTRFAPSPTGMLHVGGLRTALYAWLVAKQTNGKFLLRIEDTDQAREVAGAVDVILQGLEWAGIPPEEGVVLRDGNVTQEGAHGPYKQSERLSIYKEYAQKLLDTGHAYHCFCTAERLDQMRKQQQERHQAPMYDRQCLSLKPDEVKAKMDAGEKYVIRMKVPHEETITFADDIRGEVSFKGHTIDDQVLVKSDGFPTYHLAHVVDDHLMEIDIVIRGEEWLSSLPKHLLLFKFLEWTAPRYAHVPLLLNKDKSKLSKRNSSVALNDFIEKGYLPEAMLNFLAMLGWNDGTTQDLYSLAELTQAFSLDRVHKGGAIFDLEKLDWLQGQWMRKLTVDEFTKRIRPLVEAAHAQAADDKEFERKAALIQARITFFKEAPDMMGFFYMTPTVTADLLANAKQKVDAKDLPNYLTILDEVLGSIPEQEWNEERILADVKKAMEEKGVKLGQLLWPLRALLTGRDYSPGAIEVAAILGKEETMKRLQTAAKTLSA